MSVASELGVREGITTIQAFFISMCLFACFSALKYQISITRMGQINSVCHLIRRIEKNEAHFCDNPAKSV